MFGIEFAVRYAAAWFAGGIFALVCLYIALNLFDRRRHGRLERFADAHLVSRLISGLDASARRPLRWLTLLGVAALIVALAQPHWGKSMREIRKHSRDFVILLDTSESMRADDTPPSRMERAKQEIAALLERAPADRFALIAFSGGAQLLCPLTLDHGYFRTVLNSIDTNTISLEGTNVAEAMDEAIKLLQKEDQDAGISNRASRAIVLLSDGEQLEGDGVDASRRAADYARVFVVGIGGEGGAKVSLPAEWSRVIDREKREPHLSRLDEDTLANIALAGGGAYARSRADTWDIDELYGRFNTLSTRDVSGELRLRLVNRYQWALAVGVAAFAAEGLWLVLLPWLRHRRRNSDGTNQYV